MYGILKKSLFISMACGYFLPDDAENVGKRVRDEKCIRECTF